MKPHAPLSAIAALLALQPALAASPQVCDKTTRHLYSACTDEVRDDRLVGYANCANVIDEDEQAECYDEVDEEYTEAAALCKEQRSARFDVCDEVGQEAYDLSWYWVPGNFVNPDNIGGAVAPNPWFDLTPGTTNRFYGGGEEIEVTVTEETKLINGVRCRTVRDLVTADGLNVEDTDDWYAQDRWTGDVWYCGEEVKNYEFYEGDDPEMAELVDMEGSWKAFRDYAQPGILVHAIPMEGAIYRQEAAWGDAEDVAEVLTANADGLLEGDECEAAEEEPDTATVAAYLEEMCDGDCLVTLEYTAIEPEVFAHKYYAPGVGLLAEVEDGTCVLRGEPEEAGGEGGE